MTILVFFHFAVSMQAIDRNLDILVASEPVKPFHRLRFSKCVRKVLSTACGRLGRNMKEAAESLYELMLGLEDSTVLWEDKEFKKGPCLPRIIHSAPRNKWLNDTMT